MFWSVYPSWNDSSPGQSGNVPNNTKYKYKWQIYYRGYKIDKVQSLVWIPWFFRNSQKSYKGWTAEFTLNMNAEKCIFDVYFPGNGSELSINSNDFWSPTIGANQIQVSFPKILKSPEANLKILFVIFQSKFKIPENHANHM